MSKDSSMVKNTQPSSVEVVLKLSATNGADATVEEGKAEVLSAARTAEGVYRVKFKGNRPYFLGAKGYCFWAATPGDVKGYTLTHDTYDTSGANFFVDIYVWDSTFTAADIVVNQYLTVTFGFRETSRQF